MLLTGIRQWTTGGCLLICLLFFACDKTKIEAVETYPDPPTAKVKFLEGNPSPAQGTEGSLVTFNVKGLLGKEGKFEFFINQTKAEVVDIKETTVTVKVPANASTGGSSVLIDGEYYFGPTFTVRGKISIDPTFNTDLYRTNGPIFSMTATGDFYIATGGFSNYQDKATPSIIIPGIVKLNKSSLEYATPSNANASQLKVGKEGINGPVTSFVDLGNGKYLIGGQFTKYDTVKSVSGITRINADGSVDSMLVDIVGEPPLDKATVPAFNGGVSGQVQKVLYDAATGKSVVAGNFAFYTSIFYERSTIDGLYQDFINTRQLVRMNSDGSFDSSFNYDKALKKGYAGGNGFIYDAIMLPNGSVIVVGDFTSFHGVPAHGIVRIRPEDGLVDQTFQAGNGAGVDGFINRIVRNPTTGKIMLTGHFSSFNGQPANGVVMINDDGIPEPTFTLQALEGGIANFAGQLKNGKIIVTGTFNKYGNIVRPGIAILNPDGSLAPGYNNLGLFRGQVYDFIETSTASGIPGVILYGSFDRFDNKQVGNLVKFRMEN